MGIVAFLVYIIFVMIWYLMLKRSIAEAMLLGLVIVCAFNGVDVLPQTFASSLTKALTQDVMAAIILFTVMASIMTQTGIITRLVSILNSILGRFRGGPAYVSACASAMFGMVSGASSANAATVGSITIPWMTESGWPKEVAATMNTGNAGLGICIPPSSSMFLMLGLPVVAGSVAAGDLYIALMCGGLWSLAYRLLLTRYYVSKYNIPAVPKDRIVSLSSALKEGGTSLTMFLGIIVPLVVITGPVGNFLKTLPAFGEDGVDAMNIIIWVPVLIMFICIIEGRKRLGKASLLHRKDLLLLRSRFPLCYGRKQRFNCHWLRRRFNGPSVRHGYAEVSHDPDHRLRHRPGGRPVERYLHYSQPGTCGLLHYGRCGSFSCHRNCQLPDFCLHRGSFPANVLPYLRVQQYCRRGGRQRYV